MGVMECTHLCWTDSTGDNFKQCDEDQLLADDADADTNLNSYHRALLYYLKSAPERRVCPLWRVLADQNLVLPDSPTGGGASSSGRRVSKRRTPDRQGHTLIHEPTAFLTADQDTARACRKRKLVNCVSQVPRSDMRKRFQGLLSIIRRGEAKGCH